jgi:hypothetical protein
MRSSAAPFFLHLGDQVRLYRQHPFCCRPSQHGLLQPEGIKGLPCLPANAKIPYAAREVRQALQRSERSNLSDRPIRREVCHLIRNIKRTTAIPNVLEPNFTTEASSGWFLRLLVNIPCISTICFFKYQPNVVEAIAPLRKELSLDIDLSTIMSITWRSSTTASQNRGMTPVGGAAVHLGRVG